MTVVLTLLLRRVRSIGKLIRDREGTKSVVMALFALLFGVVMVGEYVMFRQALVEVLGIGPASDGLTLYILESFLILVLIIAVISYFVTGLWTFYRSSDTAFLLSSPLALSHLFWLRTAETFFVICWAFVLLAVPAFLALGAAYERHAIFYVRAVVILILFMMLAGGLGALLTMLAGAAFKRQEIRTSILVTTLILVGGLAFLIGRHIVPATGDFYRIFEPGIPNGTPGSLKFIENRFWLWPSHPLAVSLFTGVTGPKTGLTAPLVGIFLLPLGALVLAGVVGRRLFAATIPVVAERFGVTSHVTGRPTARVASFPRFLRGPIGAVAERDLLSLVRSPHELGRAAFILFLLALYTAILFVAPLSEILEKPEAVARLFSLDLMAIGYFLTAFGLRFVFPALSLEGRGAWILFASPLSIFSLFLGRLLGYSVLLVLMVGPIATAGAWRLATFPALLGLFGFLLGLLIVTTVIISLGAGVIWPNFREPNAETLATNTGGLATIILSLAYVATVSWLGHRAASALFLGETLLPELGGAALLSAVIVAVAITAARWRIKALEIL